MKFTGRVVVVTGAAAGIGLCLVRAFAKLGATVYATDVDELGLKNLNNQAAQEGWDVHSRAGDVTDEQSLRDLANQVLRESGQLDYWVNNAGIQQMGRFTDMTPKQWNRIIQVNLTAVINATRVALELMQQRGCGQIINIASCAGHIPAPYMTAYTASKHAVVGFTRALNAELAMENSPIQTMLVSPGFVETKIIERGAELGFPNWLSFMLSTPEVVAQSVIDGIKRNKPEVFPTLNGKLMLAMHHWAPKSTIRSSRILLTKSLKDLVLNRYQLP